MRLFNPDTSVTVAPLISADGRYLQQPVANQPTGGGECVLSVDAREVYIQVRGIPVEGVVHSVAARDQRWRMWSSVSRILQTLIASIVTTVGCLLLGTIVDPIIFGGGLDSPPDGNSLQTGLYLSASFLLVIVGLGMLVSNASFDFCTVCQAVTYLCLMALTTIFAEVTVDSTEVFSNLGKIITFSTACAPLLYEVASGLLCYQDENAAAPDPVVSLGAAF